MAIARVVRRGEKGARALVRPGDAHDRFGGVGPRLGPAPTVSWAVRMVWRPALASDGHVATQQLNRVRFTGSGGPAWGCCHACTPGVARWAPNPGFPVRKGACVDPDSGIDSYLQLPSLHLPRRACPGLHITHRCIMCSSSMQTPQGLFGRGSPFVSLHQTGSVQAERSRVGLCHARSHTQYRKRAHGPLTRQSPDPGGVRVLGAPELSWRKEWVVWWVGGEYRVVTIRGCRVCLIAATSMGRRLGAEGVSDVKSSGKGKGYEKGGL